ncbi:MAG: phage holin family protein [Clostridia bacterium]|nr:phage holin family protein [Clostridia bacterium]
MPTASCCISEVYTTSQYTKSENNTTNIFMFQNYRMKANEEEINSIDEEIQNIERLIENIKYISDPSELLSEKCIIDKKIEYIRQRLHTLELEKQATIALSQRKGSDAYMANFKKRIFMPVTSFILAKVDLTLSDVQKEFAEWTVFFDKKITISLILGVLLSFLGFYDPFIRLMVLTVFIGSLFGRIDIKIESFNDLFKMLNKRAKLFIAPFLILAIVRAIDLNLFKITILTQLAAVYYFLTYLLKIIDTVQQWTGIPLFPILKKILDKYRDYTEKSREQYESDNSTFGL